MNVYILTSMFVAIYLALWSGVEVKAKVKCVVHRGMDPVIPVFQGPKMRKNGFLSRGQGQRSRSSSV